MRQKLGSGGGSVRRAVPSDKRFETQHRQNFYQPFVLLNRKDESKEKEAGNDPS